MRKWPWCLLEQSEARINDRAVLTLMGVGRDSERMTDNGDWSEEVTATVTNNCVVPRHFPESNKLVM